MLQRCQCEAHAGLARLAFRRFALGLPAPGLDLHSFAVANESLAAMELVVLGLDSDSDKEDIT